MKKSCVKVLVFVIVVSLLLGSSSLSYIAEDCSTEDSGLYTIDGYRLESIADLTEEISSISAKYLQLDPLRSFPSSVDNSSVFPSPEENGQGSQPSCTSWAVTYAAMSREEKQKWGWSTYSNEHCFSPAFAYNSLINVTGGKHITSVMGFLVSNGACSLNIMPYNPSSTTAPNTLQCAVASYFKASSYYSISGTDGVKTALVSGDGVVFAFKVPTTFSSTNCVIYGNETIGNGAHSVCIVGYNDNMYGGAFKFINSWGDDWGQNGYGWITYNAFNSTNVNNYGGGVGWVISYGSDYSLQSNMGDVNFDGVVNANDTRLVLRYSSNLETYTNEQFIRADVDGSGAITSTDATSVLRFAAGLETTFPYFE